MINVSPLEEYTLRCMIQLAKRYESARDQRPVSASTIAELEGISVEYVSKIFHLLKKSGLLMTTRGIQGGYQLARSPENITLKDIFDAIRSRKSCEKPISEEFCNHYAGQHDTCVHLKNCSIRPVWEILGEHFDHFLKSLALNAFIQSEGHVIKTLKHMELSTSYVTPSATV